MAYIKRFENAADDEYASVWKDSPSCPVVPELPHTLCPLWAHSKHVFQRELENALIA